jgi:hypothetical protein
MLASDPEIAAQYRAYRAEHHDRFKARDLVMVAPMVLDGPINGDWFEAYVVHVLVPELRPGDIVIMDNLSSHKREAVRERIEGCGRNAALPAALQSGLQPDRESILPPPGHAPKGRRTNGQRPLEPDRQTRRHLPSRRMRQLLQVMRL